MKNIEICFSYVGVGNRASFKNLLDNNLNFLYKVTSPQRTFNSLFGGLTNIAGNVSQKIRKKGLISLNWHQAAVPYAWP